MQCLKCVPSDEGDPYLESQLELSKAWSTFLCVAASQDTTFHLTSQELHQSILLDTLNALLTRLDRATTTTSNHQSSHVLTALELSVLSMVLTNKWVSDLGATCRCEMAEVLAMIVAALSHLKSPLTVELLVHVTATLLKLLLSFTTRKGERECVRWVGCVCVWEGGCVCVGGWLCVCGRGLCVCVWGGGWLCVCVRAGCVCVCCSLRFYQIMELIFVVLSFRTSPVWARSQFYSISRGHI